MRDQQLDSFVCNAQRRSGTCQFRRNMKNLLSIIDIYSCSLLADRKNDRIVIAPFEI